MKMRFKQKTLKQLPLVILSLMLGYGCAKDDPQPTTPTPTTQNSSGTWGEFISIPDLSTANNDVARNLKTTNQGVYVEVIKSLVPETWIYRLENGGPSPSWIHYKHEEPFLWAPTKNTTESPNQFSIFFMTLDKNGYVNINTGVPAILDQDNPLRKDFSAPDKMLVDNSSAGNRWAIWDRLITVENKVSAKYDSLYKVPDGHAIRFIEADPKEPMIWVAEENMLHKITASGQITSFDVSSFFDPSVSHSSSIEKVRFSYDPLHKDVYFRFQNKIFKIADGVTLSLFYSINYGTNSLGGDFAIDNSYMYTTDGTKKSLALSTQTNIIPPQPTSKDPAILQDYFMQVASFNIGPLEVSKDPLDQYIYLIAGIKILKIPKTPK